MKTIQVSDEVYEFLKECQEELNTQNNRITHNPIFGFKVKQEVASYDPKFYVFVTYDHTNKIAKTHVEGWEENLAQYIMDCYDTIEELYDFLVNNILYYDWSPQHHFSDDNEFEDAIKKELIEYIKDLNYYDYNNFAEQVDLKVFGYDIEWAIYSESFSLFASDLGAHENMNKHNMGEYRSYADSNYRTPKMEQLYNVLKSEIKFE